MNKEIREDIDRACETMGVKDDRTALKHLRRFDSCLGDKVKRFAGIVSASGEKLPDKEPEFGSVTDNNIKWLEALGAGIKSIREKLYGYENISHQDIEGLFIFFDHCCYPCTTINNNTKNIIELAWQKYPPPNDVLERYKNHVTLLLEKRGT